MLCMPLGKARAQAPSSVTLAGHALGLGSAQAPSYVTVAVHSLWPCRPARVVVAASLTFKVGQPAATVLQVWHVKVATCSPSPTSDRAVHTPAIARHRLRVWCTVMPLLIAFVQCTG
jgi:hypothetical protein